MGRSKLVHREWIISSSDADANVSEDADHARDVALAPSGSPGPGGQRDGEGWSRPAAETSEQAIRTFIIAMVTKDAANVRAVTLPVDDLDSLLQRLSIPPEAVAGFKAQIAELPVRVLKAGEEVTLADGRKYKASSEDIGPDRAVVLPQGASFPAMPKGGRPVAGRRGADHREPEGQCCQDGRSRPDQGEGHDQATAESSTSSSAGRAT